MYYIDQGSALEILYKKLEEFILELKDINDAEQEEYEDEYTKNIVFANSKKDKFKLELKINLLNNRLNQINNYHNAKKINFHDFIQKVFRQLNEIDGKDFKLM